MNLEGAKKLDPPHLTPLKKRGGDGGGVFWPFFFFFLRRCRCPPLLGKLGIWKLKKGRMKEGCVGRIWFRLVS